MIDYFPNTLYVRLRKKMKKIQKNKLYSERSTKHLLHPFNLSFVEHFKANNGYTCHYMSIF